MNTNTLIKDKTFLLRNEREILFFFFDNKKVKKKGGTLVPPKIFAHFVTQSCV